MNPHHQQVADVLSRHFGTREFIGIEIGTAEAELTVGLLASFPNLKMLYSIDPYRYVPGTEFEASLHNQVWHDDRRRRANESLGGYPTRSNHLCITSDEAVDYTPVSVDFVWVDGDHTLTQVVKDIDNYYKKVKHGGIFGGHDWHDVGDLVTEKLTEKISLGADLTWWVIKQ